MKPLPPSIAPKSAPALAELADPELVGLACEGRREAFEELVRRHQRPLVQYLYRLVRCREAALDLAQEVFVKVYTSLASYDPRYRFTTWLYRIAANAAIDQQRKRRLSTCSMDGDAAGGSGLRPEPIGSLPAPDETVQAVQLRRRIEQALAELPPGYRKLLLLRHQLHLRYDEIARACRLPLGTVKNRIFRAREMLRRQLADVLGEPERR